MLKNTSCDSRECAQPPLPARDAFSVYEHDAVRAQLQVAADGLVQLGSCDARHDYVSPHTCDEGQVGDEGRLVSSNGVRATIKCCFDWKINVGEK